MERGKNLFSREKKVFLLPPNPSPLFKKSGVFVEGIIGFWRRILLRASLPSVTVRYHPLSSVIVRYCPFLQNGTLANRAFFLFALDFNIDVCYNIIDVNVYIFLHKVFLCCQ